MCGRSMECLTVLGDFVMLVVCAGFTCAYHELLEARAAGIGLQPPTPELAATASVGATGFLS